MTVDDLTVDELTLDDLTWYRKNQFSFTSQGAAVAGYARIGNLQDQVQGPTIRHEDRSLSCVSILLNWWMLLHF